MLSPCATTFINIPQIIFLGSLVIENKKYVRVLLYSYEAGITTSDGLEKIDLVDCKTQCVVVSSSVNENV